MTILLIDGDPLIYSSCPSRNIPDDYRGVRRLDSNGNYIRELYEFSREENEKYLRGCWAIFDNKLKELQNTLFTEEYLIAVKGKGNFRKDLYDGYKNNRNYISSMMMFVDELRLLAVLQYDAIPADGREADDLVRIWAEQCIHLNEDFIVVTIDKDLKCIPGKYYNLQTKELIEINKEQARKFYYMQLISGDPTDCIPGVPGMGKIKSEKLIQSCNTEEECQEAVVDAYIRTYNDKWFEYLLSNGKLLHIQKHLNDYFDEVINWPVVRELL